MIPLIHPYLKIIQGECHHRKRYSHYPALGMILEPEKDTDDQDLEIVAAMYWRLAVNFHSVLHFVKTTQEDPENVVKEITNLKALKTKKRLKEFQKLSQYLFLINNKNMRITLFNGSPRRKASNSKLLMDQFLKGYHAVKEDGIDVYYLADIQKSETHKEAYSKSDIVLIIFPLYTDSMPGIVKYFIEQIYLLPFNPERKVGFIVQSDFPEAKHPVFVEQYLERLIHRTHNRFLGTIIKEGVEGIQVRSARKNRKLFHQFFLSGKYFGENGQFDQNMARQMAAPYQFNKFILLVLKLMSLTGLMNIYWNRKLMEHNAYQKRFAKPYFAKDFIP